MKVEKNLRVQRLLVKLTPGHLLSPIKCYFILVINSGIFLNVVPDDMLILYHQIIKIWPKYVNKCNQM
jgi:hypothetical protein